MMVEGPSQQYLMALLQLTIFQLSHISYHTSKTGGTPNEDRFLTACTSVLNLGSQLHTPKEIHRTIFIIHMRQLHRHNV
jgi:hypothetical protein